MTFLLMLPLMAYLFWLTIRQQQRILRTEEAIRLMATAMQTLYQRVSLEHMDHDDEKTH